MIRLLFATHNVHKVTEVRALLDGTGVELETLADIGFTEDPPETQDTFEGNALQKARFVYARTGRACVADDSGIEVVALGGAPGVHSKRFSPSQQPDDNNRLLLAKLEGIEDRRARFRCVIAVVGPDGEGTAEGRVDGTIGDEPRGSGGFGYDPLFWPVETPGRTMAELAMEEKNAISHRGRAFLQLPRLVGMAPPS